ncbi:MAG: hypothetical protein KDD66_17000 [Bdellovibrionales bacterium]|nr:hypothetical protein [Bdellovibrionales bacterium]
MEDKEKPGKLFEDFVQEPLLDQESEEEPPPQSPQSVLRFFLLVVLISAVVSVFAVSSPQGKEGTVEEEHERQAYLTWFTEDKAVKPFKDQWKKSRLLEFSQLVQFAKDIEQQIDEEANPRYEALQTTHERRLALLKTYFGDHDVIGVEIGYELFHNATQLIDSNQIVIPIYKGPRDLSDGGLADFEFSLVLSVDPALIREHLFIKPEKGVDTDAAMNEKISIMFSAVDADSNESSKMVRPMKVASRRSNPTITTRNEWVRYRDDKAQMYAELEGAMLGDGSNGHAMIKGFIYR